LFPDLPRHVIASEQRADGPWQLWMAEGPGPRQLVLGVTDGHGERGHVGGPTALGAFGPWGHGRSRSATSEHAEAFGFVSDMAEKVRLILSDLSVIEASLMPLPLDRARGFQAFFAELPYARLLIRAEAWSAHGYLLGSVIVPT
jgi:hypothetical protein